jgi:hypothetical protein
LQKLPAPEALAQPGRLALLVKKARQGQLALMGLF